MKNKLTKVLLLLIIIPICTICFFTTFFVYVFSGGIFISQDELKIELEAEAENPQMKWSSIVSKKHTSQYFVVMETIYLEDSIYFEVQEDILGSQGSGVNITVSKRYFEVDKVNGDIDEVGQLPILSESVTQVKNFSLDYPELKESISYKYQVEFFRNGTSYWSVDIREENEFKEIDDLSKFVCDIYGDYSILYPKPSEDGKIYVFNIRTKKLAFNIDLKNDSLALGQSIFVEGSDFYFVTERGGVFKISSD